MQEKREKYRAQMISENRNENEKNDKTVHLFLRVIIHKRICWVPAIGILTLA